MNIKQKMNLLMESPFFKRLRSLLQERESRHQWNNWVCFGLQLIFSYLLLFVIEALARHSITEAFSFLIDSTHVFFYNGLMIFLSSLIVFLFRKRRLFRFIIFTSWFILGIINSAVLGSRVTPLTGPDFKNITEAAAVVKKYFSGIEIILFILLLILIIGFIIIYAFKSPRYKGKMHYFLNIGMIALCLFGFYHFTEYYIHEDYLSSYFSNIAHAYEDYGFPYCFTVTVIDTGMNEPNNYSQQMIDQIIETSEEKVGETTADLDEMPNIIVVQLESFFDMTRVEGLETNKDPLPNWHKLCEEYTSGLYHVPTFGAGTVNTEFETLTGMSMHYFGAGEYPYKSILKEEACESSAFVLKDFGYTCFAVHDNEANFYSRKKVYKNLGFDYFISGEYMLNQDDVNENGWMRDENLITPITECLDSTDGQDFVFTVSVQPHGSYPTEEVLDDPKIKVSSDSFSEEELNEWEYYANQIYEEDQFIADLIQTVEDRNEPTVILFYGDHLPTMNISDKDLSSGSTFDTGYLMWNNLGLKQNDRKIYSNQAMASVFDQIGIHEGTIFNYQQSNLDKKEKNYSAKLQALQYDLLYGEQYQYSYKQYIPNTEYRLGLHDPAISSITSMSDEIYSVMGSYFTQSCKVEINGELAETVFVSSSQLLVIKSPINSGDLVKIGVQSNSSTHKILSYSNSYLISDSGQMIDQGKESDSMDLDDPESATEIEIKDD